jgi:hypothetical protein
VPHLSSANIVISSTLSTTLQSPRGSILANSPVLEYLIPQLSVWRTNGLKPQQRLENIDSYMLEETALLLERVGKFCLRLGLSDSTTFDIKLANKALHVKGQFDEKAQLGELVNQDRWINGAFNWLHGNYSALAHSQELLSFSFAYEKNRLQALGEYRHFEHLNQGMECYLSRRIEDGKAKLSWLVESPSVIYHLNS